MIFCICQKTTGGPEHSWAYRHKALWYARSSAVLSFHLLWLIVLGMDEHWAQRRRKVFVALAGLLASTIIIVAVRRGGRPVEGSVNGVPIYPGAEFNRQMTHTAEPWMLVFLTGDDVDRVLAFYTRGLGAKPKRLEYGKGQMLVWQYNLEGEADARERERTGGSLLRNSVFRGVEIIPLNSIYRRAYGKNTKIKIILPRRDVPADVLALVYPDQPPVSEK